MVRGVSATTDDNRQRRTADNRRQSPPTYVPGALTLCESGADDRRRHASGHFYSTVELVAPSARFSLATRESYLTTHALVYHIRTTFALERCCAADGASASEFCVCSDASVGCVLYTASLPLRMCTPRERDSTPTRAGESFAASNCACGVCGVTAHPACRRLFLRTTRFFCASAASGLRACGVLA